MNQCSVVLDFYEEHLVLVQTNKIGVGLQKFQSQTGFENQTQFQFGVLLNGSKAQAPIKVQMPWQWTIWYSVLSFPKTHSKFSMVHIVVMGAI